MWTDQCGGVLAEPVIEIVGYEAPSLPGEPVPLAPTPVPEPTGLLLVGVLLLSRFATMR